VRRTEGWKSNARTRSVLWNGAWLFGGMHDGNDSAVWHHDNSIDGSPWSEANWQVQWRGAIPV